MRRSSLLLLLPLLACNRTNVRSTAASPDAGPSSEDGEGEGAQSEAADAGPSELEIVPVPQYGAPVPGEWLFDPDGARIAALHGDGCGIWDIETGLFLGTIPDEPEGPCESWMFADEIGPSERSADDTLEATIDGSDIVVVSAADHSPVARVSCTDCEEVLALAWAPGGHTLAAVSAGPPAVEVWNIDTKASLEWRPLSAGEINYALLGWNEEGIVATIERTIEVECDESEYYGCDYDYDGRPLPVDKPAISTFFWPADGSRAVIADPRHVGVGLDLAFVDPKMRYLFVIEEDMQPRMDSSYELLGLGLTGADSPLSWSMDSEYGGYGYGESYEYGDGSWRVDASSQWIETIVERRYDYDGGWMQLGWRSIEVEPGFGVTDETLFEGDVHSSPEGGVAVYGVFGGKGLVSWDVCGEHEDGSCTERALPLAGCDPVEYEASSPRLELVLADCNGSLALIEPGRVVARPAPAPSSPAASSPDPGRIRHRLKISSEAEHLWGRGPWLALHEGSGRLSVVDLGTGKVALSRSDVVGFANVALAATHDRLALITDKGLELIEPLTGKVVIAVEKPLGMAGLSPDGKRLAGVFGDELVVWSLAEGKALGRWPLATYEHGDYGLDVAFRQDGAALMLGIDLPIFAVDANTGAALEIYDVEDWYELGVHTIDPSWRWIHDSDGSIVRTLDMRRLWIGHDGQRAWARLDSGEFDGQAPITDVRYRIGPDPMTLPRFEHAQLRKWLAHQNLARDFFAGAPLARPQLSKEDYQRLVKETGL